MIKTEHCFWLIIFLLIDSWGSSTGRILDSDPPIHCFQCNSTSNPECLEVVEGDKNSKFYKVCPKPDVNAAGVISPDVEYLCYKVIVPLVPELERYKMNDRPFIRKKRSHYINSTGAMVGRGCSYNRIKEILGCNPIRLGRYDAFNCQCNTDGCNTATTTTTTTRNSWVFGLFLVFFTT